MAKRLFLIPFFGFIGVIFSPGFLAAENVFQVKMPEFYAVETKPVVYSAPVITQNTTKSTQIDKPVVQAFVPKMTNYSISYFIGSPKEFNDTAYNLSYNGLYKYRKMIYGHNSANLLGNLSRRQVGELITITEGGSIQNYQVKDVRVYQKTADGFLNGDQSLMTQIANTALGFDVALFTCAGTSYGNGDASHRLVVFANRV